MPIKYYPKNEITLEGKNNILSFFNVEDEISKGIVTRGGKDKVYNNGNLIIKVNKDRYERLLGFEKMNDNIYKIEESEMGKGLRITLVDWTNGRIIKELKYRKWEIFFI